MTTAELFAFMQRHTLAVEATVSMSGGPQAAVVGFIVTERLEVFFDTLDTTRKFQNLRSNPKVAVVIGWDEEEERTVQYEGLADVPQGAELARLQDLYFQRFPDGPSRQSWPGLVYVRVRPKWIRYSDFLKNPPEIVEFTEAELNA